MVHRNNKTNCIDMKLIKLFQRTNERFVKWTTKNKARKIFVLSISWILAPVMVALSFVLSPLLLAVAIYLHKKLQQQTGAAENELLNKRQTIN